MDRVFSAAMRHATQFMSAQNIMKNVIEPTQVIQRALSEQNYAHSPVEGSPECSRLAALQTNLDESLGAVELPRKDSGVQSVRLLDAGRQPSS